MQFQSLGRGQRFKADMNLFQQSGRMESHPVYFRFMEIKSMKIEQVDHQFQQMFRGSFHVIQIETLPFVHRQPGKQIGISHNGTEWRFKVVGNGKHHLLPHGQQIFGALAGFFQLATVTVAARNVTPYNYQEKDGQQHCPHCNAADYLNGMAAHRLPVVRLFAGTLQGFLFISLQQTVYTGGQHLVHALQSEPAASHNRVAHLLLLRHSTQFFLKGVYRIVDIDHCIRSVFKGSLHLNGGIFFGRYKHFAQTAEETFLLGFGNHCVAMRDDTALYAPVGDHRVLPGGYDILYRTGRHHAFTGLAQHTQHINGILIFLPEQRNQAVRPVHILIFGMHEILHFPVHKEQGKEQHSQQQSVSDDYLYFRYTIHRLKKKDRTIISSRSLIPEAQP